MVVSKYPPLTPGEHIVKEHIMLADEAARALGISVKTVQKRFRDGEIPAEKKGNNWYVKTSDVITYMGGTAFDEDEDEDEPDDLISLEDEEVLGMLGYEDSEALFGDIEDGSIYLDLYTDEDGDWLVSEEEVLELAETLEDNDSSEDEDDSDEDDDSEDDDWREDDEDEE